MNREKQYIAWLIAGLAKKGKSQKGLASALGLHPSAVTQMKKGKRRIQAADLQVISEYIGERIPGREPSDEGSQDLVLGNAQTVPLVRVTTVIAPLVWRETAVVLAITERVPGSPDRRLAGMKQYACKIEADPNRYAICVAFGDIRNKPMQNDVVHTRRTTNGRYEDTLRVVHITGNVTRLIAEGIKGRDAAVSYPSAKPSETVEIKGLVVGYFNSTTF